MSSEVTIDVSDHFGRVNWQGVRAHVIRKGLAVHPSVDRMSKWTVTHMGTGLYVARGRTRREAEYRARKVARVVEENGYSVDRLNKDITQNMPHELLDRIHRIQRYAYNA